MGGRDLAADCLQVRRRWHVHTAADPDPRRCDLEVQARTLGARELPAREVGANRGLERCLVAAETSVAVDSKERDLRIRDQLRRELLEIEGKPAQHVNHRATDMALVIVFARTEPFTIVVALQGAQKGERLRCEHWEYLILESLEEIT
jgi:hypothetical protein